MASVIQEWFNYLITVFASEDERKTGRQVGSRGLRLSTGWAWEEEEDVLRAVVALTQRMSVPKELCSLEWGRNTYPPQVQLISMSLLPT